MKKLLTLICGILLANMVSGQGPTPPPPIKVMPLGVFHFAYPNLDVVKTKEKDQISVLDEPFQSEIIAVSKAIEAFNPSIIAIEVTPDEQPVIDSLFSSYQEGKFTLKKNEIYQLAFRIGKNLNHSKVYCVNDWGKHYSDIEAMYTDSARAAKFEYYYYHSPDSVYEIPSSAQKVSSIIDKLYALNNPVYLKQRLSQYLMTPFKYEEEEGDFSGVDFETGRWFNRNLRIFRNIQRLPHNSSDKILLIMGADHLNLLNLFFDVSKEFELVSPLPYLKSAKTK